MKTTCITRSTEYFTPPPAGKQASLLPVQPPSLPTSPRLTESKSLAGLANNSSLDVLAAEKSVLVRNALESASGSRVLGGAEVVVVLDGVALLLGELRGKRVLDVDEDVALDEGLGTCWKVWVSNFLFFSPMLDYFVLSRTHSGVDLHSEEFKSA